MNKILVVTPICEKFNSITADARASLVAWHVKNNDDIVSIQTTKDVYLHRSRNDSVSVALDMEFTHVLFMDSDMVFGKKDLQTLLEHHKDIVSGLYYESWDGDRPCAYDMGNNKATPIKDANEIGMRKVDAVGAGFMLVDTKVFQRVEWPWFDFAGFLGEDFYFCQLARSSGFDIWLDRDLRIGHISKKIYINWGPRGERMEAING